MQSFELSIPQARRLVLRCQGLHKKSPLGRGTVGALKCIEQLGYIQIDTISVVQRAHHHTLWTRVLDFRKEHLDALQKDRKVFEYWAHAASYLPMRDFRFSLPYMNAIAGGQKHWHTPDKKLMQRMIRHIRTEGPVMARHFEDTGEGKSHFWGGSKPAKIALEQLFIEGELMVSHREGFQKVFDLTERVLPRSVDTRIPSHEEFLRHLITRTIQAQGIASEPEIRYLRKGIKADLSRQIQQMIHDGEIVEVKIQENPTSYYSTPELVETGVSTRTSKRTHLLSPFDNFVIQRKRIAALFDFDYQIECYVPKHKRQHGYFCLPILFGDTIIGRLDPKADKREKTLRIENLVLEKPVSQKEQLTRQLASTLRDFAEFNQCTDCRILKSNDKKFAKDLAKVLG